MGLIKAAWNAASGTLADQWKEYFYCDAMDADVLVARGVRHVSGRSSNRKGEDNVITDGSHIAVANGQCMIIVEDGKVIDACAEPGAYTYDTKTSPSVFGGSFVEGLKGIAKEAWRRFEFGGGAGRDQRIYYVNIKEIPGNKYGTPNPVPFRVVDRNIGLDVDISIRCNGEYSYRIVNPMVFYANVCGNAGYVYTRDQIDSMLKSELLTALQPAFARISEMGIRYSALPGHTMELSDALNEVLSKKWTELRGIMVYSLGVNSVTASKEDEDMIKQLQKSAVMRDPNMAAATLAGAQADAMRMAAGNKGGAMSGFMGMGMAQQAGQANLQSLYAMGQQQAAAQGAGAMMAGGGSAAPGTGNAAAGGGSAAPGTGNAAASWSCACGAGGNTGKFCVECGAPRPSQAAGWTCAACGTVNKGRFCSECGAPKPAGIPQYRCDKCGWEPEDPAKPPKFCPECGDPFDDGDVVGSLNG
ncbi:MAG: SPFH domain-containing protein [Dorea sp.]|jgi:membrane protease subunit (stomatin/prohibitin family)|nr:SPFH domain-containing protein [Dorea sp.]